MYRHITEQLNTLCDCPQTRAICITGSNGVYSSGNDLSGFASILKPGQPAAEVQKQVLNATTLCEEFVASFINCKQPLVAKVDGMCVGITCTTLGLCDFVYASQNSWFYTPFTKIAQAPEGCSSVIFPQLMGNTRAREVLYMNKKLNAAEALERRLVGEVFESSAALDDHVENVLQELVKLPVRSLRSSKEVVEGERRKMLLEVNKRECAN